MKGLLETGEYLPVIDRSYPLERAADAATYVETQQKSGNVVLLINNDGPQLL
jgi:NADPH:quinone reductase-like Zn-dependent oxidoreductase